MVAVQLPASVARLGPRRALDALALPTQGRVVELGTELVSGMPAPSAERSGGFRITPYRTPGCLARPEAPPPFDFSMELVQGSPHVGTHLDALAHVQADGVVFGGHRAADVYDDSGWRANGVEGAPPIVTRGVLLDVPAALGATRLPDGYEVGVGDLEACLERQGVALAPGDAVLVRTGKIADFQAGGDAYFAEAPGIGVEAAVWLFEQGMAVLGSDTAATEPVPFADPARTVHRAMLVERGINLIEIMRLHELAAQRINALLIICLPLRMRGATGSWVRPVAVA
jgi:kynurenine formamidase